MPSMLSFKKHDPKDKILVPILRVSYTLHLLDLNSVVFLVDISLEKEAWKNHYV